MPTVLGHSGAESDKSSVVECMDWQAAGNLLATGSMDGWIRVWSKSGLFAVALGLGCLPWFAIHCGAAEHGCMSVVQLDCAQCLLHFAV